MNTKFYELSTRIGTVNRNAEAGESLSKENWNKISNLPSESTAHEDNLAEQANNTHKLEKDIEDQAYSNCRSTIVIRKT